MPLAPGIATGSGDDADPYEGHEGPWLRPLLPLPTFPPHSLSSPPPPRAHPTVSGHRRSGAPSRPRKALMSLRSPGFLKLKGKTLEILIFWLLAGTDAALRLVDLLSMKYVLTIIF
jgi:hypothetical protein